MALLYTVSVFSGTYAIASPQSAQAPSEDDLELFGDRYTELEVAAITARCSVVFGIADPALVAPTASGPDWRISRSLAGGSSTLAKAARLALSRHYAASGMSRSDEQLEIELTRITRQQSVRMYKELVALDSVDAQRTFIADEIEECSWWAIKARTHLFIERLAEPPDGEH